MPVKKKERASVKRTKPIKIKKKVKVKGLKVKKRKGKLIINDENYNVNNTNKALAELQKIKNLFKKGKLSYNNLNKPILKNKPKPPPIRKKREQNLAKVFNYAKNAPNIFNVNNKPYV